MEKATNKHVLPAGSGPAQVAAELKLRECKHQSVQAWRVR